MGRAERPRSARAYSSAGPNMSAVRSRFAGCVRRLWWARLLRLSAALFRSAEPHCKPRLKPMPQTSPQAYARPFLDPTLKCSLTYTAPAYRSLPRMLPILRACDTLRSKMRGSCQKSGGFHQMSALWVALWKAAREWEMKNRR